MTWGLPASLRKVSFIDRILGAELEDMSDLDAAADLERTLAVRADRCDDVADIGDLRRFGEIARNSSRRNEIHPRSRHKRRRRSRQPSDRQRSSACDGHRAAADQEIQILRRRPAALLPPSLAARASTCGSFPAFTSLSVWSPRKTRATRPSAPSYTKVLTVSIGTPRNLHRSSIVRTPGVGHFLVVP